MSLRNFKKGGRVPDINVSDLAILMVNMLEASRDELIGFEPDGTSLDHTLRNMAMTVTLALEDVESALWAANMRNERGNFYHPRGLTFDEFLGSVLGKDYKFNKDYNWIDKDKPNETRDS